MTVTRVDKDLDRLTLTVVAEFDAPVERVWELLADPRKLERWWGPPTWPATVEEHDLRPGGRVRYVMTGPEGATSRGWWRIEAVEPPHALAFADGFAGDDGAPITDSAVTTVRIRLREDAGRTRMEMRSTFASREHMDQVVELGAVEALQVSMGQMDGLLAA